MNKSFILLGMSLFFLAPPARSAVLQTSSVFDFATGLEIEGGFATLKREPDGVELNIKTKLSEAAYTVWWVIFNNPEFCLNSCGPDDFESQGGDPRVNASVFWATGKTVDNEEEMTSFSAQLGLNFLPPGPDQVNFGDGLLGAFGPEIHAIIRSHGRVIPELEQEQITTFSAGCDINTCLDVQFAVFPSVQVPESHTGLGLLSFGILGAALVGKRQFKFSKVTDRKTI